MVEDLAGEKERRGERSLRESSRRTRVALAPRGRSFRRRRLLGSKHKALEAHYHHVRATPSGIAPPCRAPCALRRPEKKGKKGGSDDQADRGTSELPRARAHVAVSPNVAGTARCPTRDSGSRRHWLVAAEPLESVLASGSRGGGGHAVDTTIAREHRGKVGEQRRATGAQPPWAATSRPCSWSSSTS